jgi:hypothetical protein
MGSFLQNLIGYTPGAKDLPVPNLTGAAGYD